MSEKNFEKNNYRFISFDLETTGLDTKKDEIIQIGIVEFEKNGKIISSYESYVKTQKNISDMVNYITGLDEKSLENAPSFEDIKEKILPYFSKKCILVGHNIGFDIAILKRYIDFECNFIDTFDLSKALVSFCPSYGLEALTSYLGLEKGKFHDALSDAVLAKNLFCYLLEKINFLCKKYPTLEYALQNSENILKNILDSKGENLGLPVLEKKSEKQVLDYENKNNFEYGEKIYLHSKIENIIDFLPKNNVIFALSSLQKCNFMKNILEKKGIDFENMYQKSSFDEEKIKKFLAQKNFDKDEIYFLIKYFNSFENGYTYLDINGAGEYKIFDFLTQNIEQNFEGVSITTHQNLYKQNLEGKNIVFFDESWWFSTFAKHQNSTLDLNNILNSLEVLKYSSKFEDKNIENNFQSLIDKFSIFVGIFFLEILPSFRGTSSSHIDMKPLLGDIDFWQTQKSLENILDFVQNTNFGEYASQLEKIFSNLSNYVDDVYQIEKKMIGETINFVLKKSYPVSYIDFLNLFEKSNIIFVTTNPYKATKTFGNGGDNILINIQKTPQNIEKSLDFGKNNFVISLLMKNTKEIFNSLIKKQKNIFAENITGGIGKNIFSIKNNSGNKTMIGGQEMLFALISQGVKIDEIYLLSTGGALEKNILDDMKIYL